MLRKIAERLLRGWKIKRKLPKRFGGTSIYISPDSQLKYLKFSESAFDSNLLAVVDRYIRENSIVWDIGANVGVFAFASAAKCKNGFVLAVEADFWLVSCLKESVRLKENADCKVSVLPCAIAEKNGVATFSIAKRGRASNHLTSVSGRGTSGGARETVTVPTLTLDTLLEYFKAPTFLKIDVEGAEALVLEGACILLADVRPVIYIEVGNEKALSVSQILIKNRYLLFDGNLDLTGQEPGTGCFGDTLAIPQELYEFVKKGGNG